VAPTVDLADAWRLPRLREDLYSRPMMRGTTTDSSPVDKGCEGKGVERPERSPRRARALLAKRLGAGSECVGLICPGDPERIRGRSVGRGRG
jgi:hypothetical protein